MKIIPEISWGYFTETFIYNDVHNNQGDNKIMIKWKYIDNTPFQKYLF